MTTQANAVRSSGKPVVKGSMGLDDEDLDDDDDDDDDVSVINIH